MTHVDWDLDVAEKGGYPDFMLKEIHEQPRVIRDTLAGRLVNGALSIDELDLTLEELNLIDACTSSPAARRIMRASSRRTSSRVGRASPRKWRWPANSATVTPIITAVPPWWWPCRSRARRPTRWPPSATRA